MVNIYGTNRLISNLLLPLLILICSSKFQNRYTNVQDYIDNYTTITAISLSQMSVLFKIYFGLLILLFVIFIFDHLINFIKKLF